MTSWVNHERNHVYKKLMIQAEYEASRSKTKVIISKPIEGE